MTLCNKTFPTACIVMRARPGNFWHERNNQNRHENYYTQIGCAKYLPASPLDHCHLSRLSHPANEQNSMILVQFYATTTEWFFVFVCVSVITLCIAILGMKYLVYEKVWSFNWVYLVKWAYSQQNQKHSVSGYDFHGLMVLHNIFTLTRSPFRPSCPLSPGGPGWPIGPMSIAQIRTQIQLNCNIHRHIYMMKNSQNSTMMMINKWTQRAFIIWTYLEVRLAVQQSSWIWKRINNLVS